MPKTLRSNLDSEISFRRMPVDEWGGLASVYEECRSDDPFPLPDPNQANIVVAEHAGRLVGCVGAERAWNVSPFWVDREFRGQGIAERLSHQIVQTNTEKLPALLITTSRHVELLVFGMGFTPVAGTLWRLKP